MQLLPIDADSYRCHPIHATDRIWSETNCYVDLWVEVLHSLGHDPIPAAAAVLSTDFDGHQWSFLKFAAEDLRALYGIEVAELNIWQSVLDHVVQELEQGRLLTVEVDAYWLPETAGTSYRSEHTKTTIVPNRVDPVGQTMEYFHNSGYYRLIATDFRGVFRVGGVTPVTLLPYVEVVGLDRRHPPQLDVELSLARAHLARRPDRNPVSALAEGVRVALPWLTGGGLEPFHRWSFGVLRQCGASAELGADLSRYLGSRGVKGADSAAGPFQAVAETAKSVQFRLARAARGRAVTLDAELTAMADAWESAIQTLTDCL